MSTGIEIRARALRAALVTAAVLLCALPATACATERVATPSTLASVFAESGAGDTILLASGDYGVFRGAMKSGEVTLRAQPGAAASIELRFRPATNITIDGLTIRAIEIGGTATKSIVVRNSDIPGQTTIDTDEIQNAGILFERNVHRDWNKTDDCRCGEGRISIQGNSQQPSGITIQNSEFRGGMSDGIQNGSNGTKILFNEFHHLVAGTPDGVHTDAIQLYGSSNTLIRGNYFHDVGSQQIMSPDGADHEIIEDNVFGPGDYPFAITLYSDNGSIIRHNTMAQGSCWFNLSCGILRIGAKSSCRFADECDPGTGTVVEDNVMASIAVDEGRAAFTSRSNLLHSGSARGADDLTGKPLFAGGQRPTTFAGHALAAGSPGIGNASDGLDRGIRPSVANGAAPAAARTPAVVAASTVRVLSRLRSVRRTGRLRLRIVTATGGTLAAAGAIRPGRAVSSARGGHSRRSITLRPVSLGMRAAGSHTITLRVGPAARRTLGRSRNARLSVRLTVAGVVTRTTLTVGR